MVHYCSLGSASHCLLTSCTLAESVQKHLHGKLYEKCAKKDYFTYNFSFALKKIFQGEIMLKSVLCGAVVFAFVFLTVFFCCYCCFDTNGWGCKESAEASFNE